MPIALTAATALLVAGARRWCAGTTLITAWYWAVVASLATKGSAQDAMPRLLVGTGSDQKHLLVVANSDKGLAGAFNSNIVRAALTKAAELKAAGKDVKFYLIGRKGRAPIQRAWPNAIIGQFDTTEMREPDFDFAAQIANALRDIYYSGDFDVAHIFYSRFKSALVQTPTHLQIVPIQGPPQALEDNAAIEYEPDEETILAELLPRYLRTLVLHALLENSAGEQGARMAAMDSATRNAGEMINKLTLSYNRQRQAQITKELMEIISGAEAI